MSGIDIRVITASKKITWICTSQQNTKAVKENRTVIVTLRRLGKDLFCLVLTQEMDTQNIN